MLIVISVILYICVIVMAKPVLINQSKPFTAEELRTLFDYHDHNYGSCVRSYQYWARTGNLCGHSHSAATEATIDETSLTNSWGEGAIAEDIVNVLQIDGRGPCHSTPVSVSNDLCRLLITCRLPSVYASLQTRTTKSLKSLHSIILMLPLRSKRCSCWWQ